MKKAISRLIALCFVLCLVPMSACTSEIETNNTLSYEELESSAYAVIKDAEGNIIETLNVEIETIDTATASEPTSLSKSVTYIARSSSPTSGESDPMDGVTAVLTISWNDFPGTNNQLNSVSGHWIVGDETISARKVYYSAADLWGNTLQALEKSPTQNTFEYEPTNFTGYRFYLTSYATIDSTSNRLEFGIYT